MKYKVGDKVRVKSLEWFNNSPKTEGGDVDTSTNIFTKSMTEYCGKIVTIAAISMSSYTIEEDKDTIKWHWTDEMFEDNLYINMEKSDLKPGMVIETREGNKYILLDINNKLHASRIGSHMHLDDHENNLEYSCTDFSIDKVYKIINKGSISNILTYPEDYLTLIVYVDIDIVAIVTILPQYSVIPFVKILVLVLTYPSSFLGLLLNHSNDLTLTLSPTLYFIIITLILILLALHLPI